MLVRMRTLIGGHRNGAPWPLPGETIDVPDHEAADLVAHRYADHVRAEVTEEVAGHDDAPSVDGDDQAADDNDAETGEWFDAPSVDGDDQAADDAPKRRRSKS